MGAPEKISIGQKFTWICNTLFHQVYAVVSVYILWTIFYNQKLSEKFSWHIILSSLAYVPLMGEAMILFTSDNIWSKYFERRTKCWIHGIILLVSGALVTAGIAIIVDLKGPHARHFTSIHGWTGLASWILVLLSQFLGLAAANTQLFSKFIRPVYTKLLHNVFGILGYVFGIVSLCYGMKLFSFAAYTSLDSRQAAFGLLGISTAWNVLSAFKSAYDQLTI